MLLRATRVVRQQVKKYVPPSERAVNDHLQFAEKKKTNRKIGSYIQYTIGGLVGTSVLMYFWQPWNQYSVEVSKDLRKGLWEERDNHEDYLQALKHYQLALKTARAEGMDELSLRYTGIVLKVAEMYQNLGMYDRLIETYYKLSEFIFLNLLEDKRPIENRELIIDRDLIVITRWAMLMEQEEKPDWVAQVESELRDRMAFIENHEIPPKFPWLQPNNEREQDENVKAPDLIDLISVWSNQSSKSKWIDANISDKEGQQFFKTWDILRSFNDKEWPQWIQSYLKLRQFYADLQMRKRNYPESIQILQSNVLWSIVGSLDTSKGTAVQLLNLASCWFEYGQFKNNKPALEISKSIYLKLAEVLKGSKEQSSNLAMVYYSLGIQYQLEGKNFESTKYFDNARDLAIDLGLTSIIQKIDDNYIAVSV